MESKDRAKEKLAAIKDATAMAAKMSSGDVMGAARSLLRNKEAIRTIQSGVKWQVLVGTGILLVPILLVVFFVAALSAGSTIQNPIEIFSPQQQQEYKKQSSHWMQTIHLSNGQIGLTAEEKQQIQQLHLGLPYGLLEAFHELGARTDSSNPYRTMAYIIAKLQPRAASFVPVSLRVVHILHTKNGIKEFVTYRTKMVLNTITRYNGVWKTQWEIIGGSGTQHVVLLGATLIHKNYAPLYEAEKAFGFLPRISDQQLLFRQALLLDQNFCDPAALSILDGMIGGGLPPSKGVPLPPQQLIAIFREAIRIRMQYNATHGIAGGANETWLPYLVTIAYHESGYNPDAYNPKYISDGGSPSGLMQVLPSTFREYEISPYDDIWNPLDNAIAALGRIQGAWTVPWDIPGVVSGKYKGY